MVAIEFETRMEEVMAFNHHFLKTSPSGRRIVRNNTIASVSFVVLLFGAIVYFAGDLVLFIAGGVGVVVAAIIAPKITVQTLDRRVKKMYSEGNNVGTFGWRKLV